jgi:hypothetical protein
MPLPIVRELGFGLVDRLHDDPDDPECSASAAFMPERNLDPLRPRRERRGRINEHHGARISAYPCPSIVGNFSHSDAKVGRGLCASSGRQIFFKDFDIAALITG